MPREIQVAQLENCIADDALKTLGDLIFRQGKVKGQCTAGNYDSI